MNDFNILEKTIVRELSCRLCLCNDVAKLKPLSAETKRKLRRLFDIVVRADDNLPKAICHECLQQVGIMHLYVVKVEKTQRFLEFHKMKAEENKKEQQSDIKTHNLIANYATEAKKDTPSEKNNSELPQGDSNANKLIKPSDKTKNILKKMDMKYMESMPLEEFAKTEKLDKSLLHAKNKPIPNHHTNNTDSKKPVATPEYTTDTLDPIVLIDGKPAKQGQALDRQITLFYKMECCICHESGFHFRTLMKHYKDRHGVPGYVTCCDKKFHYFYPRKIIEHMAYHLQPNIFMCNSCHQNFQTSQELAEHQANGGRSEGKIVCPRCNERFPTYRELGMHIVTHRDGKMQCDYCGKVLKHSHRKKTINHMEDIVVCSQCLRTLKGIEKQEKELKQAEERQRKKKAREIKKNISLSQKGKGKGKKTATARENTRKEPEKKKKEPEDRLYLYFW